MDVTSDRFEDLSDSDSWFNLAHDHFDWPGYGDRSWRERKEHLDVLFRNFSKIEKLLNGFERQVQIFALGEEMSDIREEAYMNGYN